MTAIVLLGALALAVALFGEPFWMFLEQDSCLDRGRVWRNNICEE
jgi:hypothetical protein